MNCESQPKSAGQIAYESYCDQIRWFDSVGNVPCRQWYQVDSSIKVAWENYAELKQTRPKKTQTKRIKNRAKCDSVFGVAALNALDHKIDNVIKPFPRLKKGRCKLTLHDTEMWKETMRYLYGENES